MRVAKTRLGVLDAVGDVRRSVSLCVHALPVSVRLLKFGAATAVGMAGAGMLKSAVSRPKEGRSLPARAVSGLRRFLFSELLAGLVLPLCRACLLGGRTQPDRRSLRTEPRRPGFFSRLFHRVCPL